MATPSKPMARHATHVDRDVEANCADSCSSLDDQAKLLGGGDSGPLDWESDEPDEPEKPQSRRWSHQCNGTTVAFLCLLLTLGSFVIPESEWTVKYLGNNIPGLAALAREHAAHHASKFIAHLKGERHCRPPPNPLLPRTQQRRVHIRGIGETYAMEEPKERGQWLVPAREDGLLSIMTPVYPDAETLGLLRNQLRSANKYLNMDSIKEWVFVTPEDKLPTLVRFLEEEVTKLPCVLARKMRVVPDEVCTPELRRHKLQEVAGSKADSIAGWMKQQLIKLACSFTITTPYFLITDADTFFMGAVEALDLMQQKECNKDSGICDLEKKIQFRAYNEMQPPLQKGAQQDWITMSGHALNMTMPRGNLRTMGVTPQILSRGVLDPMATYIESTVADRSRNETWRAYLLRLQAQQLDSEDPATRELPAWTEYDLYFDFARHQELWRKYHTHARLQRAEANLWKVEDYPSWDPCNEMDMEMRPGYWAVVQSTLHMSAELIWKKLEPCMRH